MCAGSILPPCWLVHFPILGTTSVCWSTCQVFEEPTCNQSKHYQKFLQKVPNQVHTKQFVNSFQACIMTFQTCTGSIHICTRIWRKPKCHMPRCMSYTNAEHTKIRNGTRNFQRGAESSNERAKIPIAGNALEVATFAGRNFHNFGDFWPFLESFCLGNNVRNWSHTTLIFYLWFIPLVYEQIQISTQSNFLQTEPINPPSLLSVSPFSNPIETSFNLM